MLKIQNNIFETITTEFCPKSWGTGDLARPASKIKCGNTVQNVNLKRFNISNLNL